jgi:hypothetical protein
MNSGSQPAAASTVVLDVRSRRAAGQASLPALSGALMNSTMASSFSRQAWERNASAYEAIRSMPFNTELAAGATVARLSPLRVLSPGDGLC